MSAESLTPERLRRLAAECRSVSEADAKNLLRRVAYVLEAGARIWERRAATKGDGFADDLERETHRRAREYKND